MTQSISGNSIIGFSIHITSIKIVVFLYVPVDIILQQIIHSCDKPFTNLIFFYSIGSWTSDHLNFRTSTMDSRSEKKMPSCQRKRRMEIVCCWLPQNLRRWRTSSRSRKNVGECSGTNRDSWSHLRHRVAAQDRSPAVKDLGIIELRFRWDIFFNPDFCSVFHQLRQAKFANGGSILGSTLFLLPPCGL
jgi:hypothetical protein